MACPHGDPLTKRSKMGLFLDNSGGAAHFKEGQRYGLWVSLVRHAPLKLINCYSGARGVLVFGVARDLQFE